MVNSEYISGQQGFRMERSLRPFLLLAICIVSGTFLRASLLLLYPVFAFLIIYYFRFRITASLVIMMSAALLSFLLSLYPNLFLKYKILSLWNVIPFILLLFSDPGSGKYDKTNLLAEFFRYLSWIAVINDIIGFIQIIITPESDDSFLGIYSQYSISINGLMLINAILFYYYFCLYLETKKRAHLFAFLFFGVSSTLGFYGAGLIICTAAFILSFFRFRLKAIIRTALISLTSLTVIYFAMLLIKPAALEYNIANIRKLLTFDVDKGPRKLKSFYNYGVSYPSNTKDFIFGSGPGTFVSRSAFMVGSPTYFSSITLIKDEKQPYYFKNYGYTLWNAGNTQKALYLDGFRNQPFSTMLAFLGEYGAAFTALFFFLYIHFFSRISRLYKYLRKEPGATSTYRTFKFLMLLLPLLFLIDNYVEYPEIMLIIIPAIKFAQASLLTIYHNRIQHEH